MTNRGFWLLSLLAVLALAATLSTPTAVAAATVPAVEVNASVAPAFDLREVLADEVGICSVEKPQNCSAGMYGGIWLPNFCCEFSYAMCDARCACGIEFFYCSNLFGCNSICSCEACPI